ncbi:hypothetical protein PINS_up006194 [Pythium insidiosum]|nr:hypothetical protein PINS_up006194 [Pythium insidiosum]
MSDQSTDSSYGLVALATVIFDIDSGQRLDALYPSQGALSEDAERSVAHLALPHSNKQNEGDTQFVVRFRTDCSSNEFLYGFVLFRQERDGTRSRGYLQRAFVMVSDRPYIDLYDRALRIAGPLVFKAGNAVLEPLFGNILQWPSPRFNKLLTLPLAGTFISCIVPKLIDYSKLDQTPSGDVYRQSPSGSPHFFGDLDEPLHDNKKDDLSDVDPQDGKEMVIAPDVSYLDRNEHEHGESSVNPDTQASSRPPSPSFGDVLLTKRNDPSSPFESIGLYSSFMGVENALWFLWQMMITGESLLILSPHSRTCSQATLALTSIIAPLEFRGDFRPYYALYENDFDEIAARQSNGVSNPGKMTVIGTTNPFFMKSFKKWPNAMVFPFLQTAAHSSGKSFRGGIRSIRLKGKAELDTVEDRDHAVLMRRKPRYVRPDNAVLSQLIPASQSKANGGGDEEPHIAINNAILRRHFRKLTKGFLRPFEVYFGVWAPSGTNSNLYASVDKLLKPFDIKSFLHSIRPNELPPQIRRSKWRALYTAFIRSPHFEPWFHYRRSRCKHQFNETLRSLRKTVTPSMLLTSPSGGQLPLEECKQLQNEIEATLVHERTNAQDAIDIDIVEQHLLAVKQRIEDLTS